jgi:hypothetical protein
VARHVALEAAVGKYLIRLTAEQWIKERALLVDAEARRRDAEGPIG